MQMQEMMAKAEDVAELYKVLANPNRLLILCLLIDRQELCVGEICAELPLEQSPISQHLKIMRDQGLLDSRKEGLTVYYQIADDRIKALIGLTKELYCS